MMMAFMDADSRIKVSHTVFPREETANRNSLLKEARGKWVAFLNVGDVWSPDELERQVRFMEENGHAVSYTQYGLINMRSQSRGVVIGGMTMPKFTLHVSGYTFWFTLQYFQSVSDLLYTCRFLLLNHFTVILFDNCSNDTAFYPKVNDFVSFFKV